MVGVSSWGDGLPISNRTKRPPVSNASIDSVRVAKSQFCSKPLAERLNSCSRVAATSGGKRSNNGAGCHRSPNRIASCWIAPREVTASIDQTTKAGWPGNWSGFKSTSQPGFAVVSCNANDSPRRSGANSKIRTGDEEAKPYKRRVVVKVTSLCSILQCAAPIELKRVRLNTKTRTSFDLGEQILGQVHINIFNQA